MIAACLRPLARFGARSVHQIPDMASRRPDRDLKGSDVLAAEDVPRLCGFLWYGRGGTQPDADLPATRGTRHPPIPLDYGRCCLARLASRCFHGGMLTEVPRMIEVDGALP